MLNRNDSLNRAEMIRNKDGNGVTKLTHITDNVGLCEKGRLFAMMELEPGCSVGSHIHENDFEIYYFLEGEGQVTDDGEVKKVYPGDVMITYEGHEHSLENIGDSTFKWIALILYV